MLSRIKSLPHILFLSLIAALPFQGHLEAQNNDISTLKLIEKYRNVAGGKRRLANLNSVTAKVLVEQQGVQVEAEVFKRKDAKLRLVYQLPDGSKVTQIVVDDKAWQWSSLPGENPQAISPEQTKALLIELPLVDALLDLESDYYPEKVQRAEFLPEIKQSADGFYVEGKNGTEQWIYIHLLNARKVMTKTRFARDDAWLVTTYRDYKTVSGLSFPHVIENYVEGELISKITITDMKVNNVLPDFYFTLPKTVKP